MRAFKLGDFENVANAAGITLRGISRGAFETGAIVLGASELGDFENAANAAGHSARGI